MAHTSQKHQQIQSGTLNRYLLLFKRITIETDIESFTGQEALSESFRYTVRFTSPVTYSTLSFLRGLKMAICLPPGFLVC
ncbi:hypothetical protein A9B99_13635 [Mangrovibacter phragmitis]|uniref:Uncharacterized protein n=1 Tax=Mangrovibacter phragmitis TaxID=1691903 RepID=A0A1B7L0T3_9ENTR|nr:hypothetical protein A9B99_13635 [Mangrovibacter phragmitis]